MLSHPNVDSLMVTMKSRDYGDLELGRETYAALGAGAAACLSCAHQACADACPHGVAIPELTGLTHRRLGASGGGADGQ